MKKKCCHVRMLSPNKSCSKDNLDRVIDVQQYNPLIHQQLRESKIQAAIHTYATTAGPRGKSTELSESSCCATQCETKIMASSWEKRAKTYGPATIRETQIAVSEVLGRLPFNTAAFHGCWNGACMSNRLPSSKQMEDQSSGKKSLKMTKVWRKCHISVVK